MNSDGTVSGHPCEISRTGQTPDARVFIKITSCYVIFDQHNELLYDFYMIFDQHNEFLYDFYIIFEQHNEFFDKENHLEIKELAKSQKKAPAAAF